MKWTLETGYTHSSPTVGAEGPVGAKDRKIYALLGKNRTVKRAYETGV